MDRGKLKQRCEQYLRVVEEWHNYKHTDDYIRGFRMQYTDEIIDRVPRLLELIKMAEEMAERASCSCEREGLSRTFVCGPCRFLEALDEE